MASGKYYERFLKLRDQYVKDHGNKQPEQARLSPKSFLAIVSELRAEGDALRPEEARALRLGGVRLIVDPTARNDDEMVFEGN